MRKWLLIIGIITLICSGVIGVTVKIKVDSFSEAHDKIIKWKDEVVVPLVERGITIME